MKRSISDRQDGGNLARGAGGPELGAIDRALQAEACLEAVAGDRLVAHHGGLERDRSRHPPERDATEYVGRRARGLVQPVEREVDLGVLPRREEVVGLCQTVGGRQAGPHGGRGDGDPGACRFGPPLVEFDRPRDVGEAHHHGQAPPGDVDHDFGLGQQRPCRRMHRAGEKREGKDQGAQHDRGSSCPPRIVRSQPRLAGGVR